MNMKMSSRSDVGTALSYANSESVVDVSPVPLGMKAAHDPIVLEKRLWMRRKSLEEANIVKLESILKHHKVDKITL